MKDMKSFNTSEMGIDVNDVKILINAGFRYLMRTCHQWAKDHPLVSGVLLFFYLLYIFFPSLFSILFYTFPLVICTAILLGGSRIGSQKHHETAKETKKENDDKTSSSIDRNGTSINHHDHCRRPYLQPQMSRRTFGKDKVSKEITKTTTDDKPKEEEETQDNPVSVQKSMVLGTMHMKFSKESHLKMSSSSSDIPSEKNHASGKTQSLTPGVSRSDTDSQDDDDDDDDDDEPQEERNKVVEWTEDDQRNLMILGSSEIERNKRLESLIAKRRARKLLSMQPRRSHMDHFFGGCYHPYDHHAERVGSIMVSRAMSDLEHQPGSAPSVLLPTRNPFDLPYDPQEEKPILTGGSFEDEFFGDEQQKGMPIGGHESSSFGEFKEDPVSQSVSSFFTKPRSVDKPGYSRFRRESDAEESVKDIAEELFREGETHEQDQQELSQEGQLGHEQATALPREEEKHKEQDQNDKAEGPDLVSPRKEEEEESVEVEKDTEEENIFQMDPEASVTQLKQDQLSVSKEDVDGNSEESSSSSSSISETTSINVNKNEAFRNSVRKVLTCLVIPSNKKAAAAAASGAGGGDASLASSSDHHHHHHHLMSDFSPTSTAAGPTKMEERSFYTTSRPRHAPTYSIASDMQVEVSEAGSPTSAAALDPNSPTDRESLVYDGDVERDANSGDEDLWGASPHPMRLGELGSKFKLPDIVEEGNTPCASSRGKELEEAQKRELEGEREGEGGADSSFSPRSILPEENGKDVDVLDHKSTNGDIVEPRSSVSSSSEGLASQMQGKTDHLVEYLANLAPNETGSNILEDPGPSHVRRVSAEEIITIQDESNPIFEMDEDKEEAKESRELNESQKSSEQSTFTGQSEAPKEASSATSEKIGHDELEEQTGDSGESPLIVEQNEQSLRLEDDSNYLEKAVAESDTNVREHPVHEKEPIFDSFSSTCEEDIADLSMSRSLEELGPNSEKDVKIISGSQFEGEIKVKSPNKPIIHEESTSPVRATVESDNAVYDAPLGVDEVSKEHNMTLPVKEDKPQLATIEDANMEPSSSTEVVSSRPVDDLKGNSDNLPED